VAPEPFRWTAEALLAIQEVSDDVPLTMFGHARGLALVITASMALRKFTRQPCWW